MAETLTSRVVDESTGCVNGVDLSDNDTVVAWTGCVVDGGVDMF